MTDHLVRLVWQRCPAGYGIKKLEFRPGTVGAGLFGAGVRDCIVPLGPLDTLRQYEAGLLQHEIFRDLYNSARIPGKAGVLAFVNKWGVLKSGGGGGRESLERFLRHRAGFVEFVSGKVTEEFVRELGGLRPGLGPLEIRVARKRGRRQFFFECRSLLQFCVLEFLQRTDGGIDLTACDACGALLPRHTHGRPKRYCNDRCKMAAYRAEHRDWINRKRRLVRAADRIGRKDAVDGRRARGQRKGRNLKGASTA